MKYLTIVFLVASLTKAIPLPAGINKSVIPTSPSVPKGRPPGPSRAPRKTAVARKQDGKPYTRTRKVSAESNGKASNGQNGQNGHNGKSNGSSGNGPSSNGERLNGNSASVPPLNGNGRGNGRNGMGPSKLAIVEKYPPATAAAYANTPGYLLTNTQDRFKHSETQAHSPLDHPDGVEVRGSKAAYAVAASFGKGGYATASAHGKVAAIVHNMEGTTTCVECIVPGQEPYKTTIRSAGKSDVSFVNRNPKAGPVSIRVNSDGPGSIAAAAANNV